VSSTVKGKTRQLENDGDNGQQNVLGMPRFNPDKCLDNCTRCVDACLPKAITRDKNNHVQVDYGACINCQLCTEVCPTGAMTKSEDWAFGVFDRNDLIWKKNLTQNSKNTEKKKAIFSIAYISVTSMRVHVMDVNQN